MLQLLYYEMNTLCWERYTGLQWVQTTRGGCYSEVRNFDTEGM
jgi:hypothetical protein